MMVFIDTEVSQMSGKTMDYGAVRDDGTMLHTHSPDKFCAFVDPCYVVCGHNIIDFDLRHISFGDKHRYIDTLYLSPLLFPQKPYHRLVKDDKLRTDELNNPVNDARKARDLYYDEMSAWSALSPLRRAIYSRLLAGQDKFDGFLCEATISTGVDTSLMQQDIANLIRHEYGDRLCTNAKIEAVANKYPVELAYALAIIGVDDIHSITPAWVLRNYPKVSNVLNFLLNTPCDTCDYCRRKLDAHRGLKDFFGYDEFRTFDGVPMQQKAVEAALHGESILTIFPTGGGKSLTFQLPALMAGRNMHGLTVVISPLQSLMKDQVDNLSERGIGDAVAINGLLDPIERAAAFRQVSDGTASILYISPEMLRSNTIERLLIGRNVVRIVIDEAHCFSSWGHDFRVDYLYIGDFIKHLQEQKHTHTPIAISCFTATAKQKVISDICDYFRQKLGLELRIFAASADRKNLHYSVIHADTDADKYNHLRNLLLGHGCPSIVYVSRTKRTHELCAHLRADGINALPFNGKMDPHIKVSNQEAFMSGETQAIVATSAFGMGVDKKDVGLVVHYDISSSLEDYVQEAGRAGRDPHTEADCYVLFSDSDLDKHFIFLNQTKLSISEIQQVWRAIRDLTIDRDTVNCSALDIARKAGWNDEIADIETRVKAAVSALEKAGYLKRGNNTPHIFATGITVPNMIQARERLNRSRLFDDNSREEAARIIASLIGSRSRAGNEQGESRVDYLADLLGMRREDVIRNINLMRQEGLLADTRDMHANLVRGVAHALHSMLQTEQLLISHLEQQPVTLLYKQLNEEAASQGIKRCSVRTLRHLVRFLALQGYVRKEEHVGSGSVTIQPSTSPEAIRQSLEQRTNLCRFIVNELQNSANEEGLVNFSEIALLNKYNQQSAGLFSANKQPTSISDIEESLLYLSRTELLRIDGGFLVLYNTMRLKRLAERRTRYGKEQYRMFDEFYKQRIQQIHIVGEYANLMVRDYNIALQFVRDYFTLDYRQFITRYFKGERRAEISQNITPEKYRQIFGEMSPRQLEIINDQQSRLIVVAAGPGSGKTRVLVHKLASLLLLEDVKHEQLLMLTFSRAAATEFKKRLIDLVGNAAHYVDIKTFHSFSFDLLGLQGSIEESDNVVRRAAEFIERGEVEEAKIARSVLVIDEAQDMSADDFRLVRALMQRNEEMRLIAVGDDDQNIYRFRRSDSAHLRSLRVEYGATLYEMTDNYRSDRSIVATANAFVQQLTNRMKSSPIAPVSKDEGVVEWPAHCAITDVSRSGTTACLTATNEQALQLAYIFRQQGRTVRLVQATDGFRFINLAEVRYFTKQLGDANAVPETLWTQAKQRTLEAYASSRTLAAMQTFFSSFEQTHRPPYYRSDLREVLLESSIEDFYSVDDGSVYVSTIHKAKGREFDTVHLLYDTPREYDEDALRAIYVGMTRARHHLFVHTHGLPFSSAITLSLSLRDVWLDFFRDRKAVVLRLRSGDPLHYNNGLLTTTDGTSVARLSQKMLNYIKSWEDRGYSVTEVEVSYVLAWRPRNEEHEVAVCLANIILVNHTRNAAPTSR